MAWSGGTFTRVDGTTGWQDDEAAGTGIEAGLMDTAFNDLATDGINQTINKAGQNTPTANLPMGGYKHTGVANASANDEYTTQGQLKDNSFTAELEALEIAPTSADEALTITAKSGATGTLVEIEKNGGDPILRVNNDGGVLVNSTGFIAGAASAMDIRARNGTSTGTTYVNTYSEISDSESIGFFPVATRSGGAVRGAFLGLYKHSGITECCAYLELEQEGGQNSRIWVDNFAVVRISPTLNHVGTTAGTVIGTQTSDERLKEIDPAGVQYGLDTVKQLKPIAYVRKDDSEQTKRLGFGAQTTKAIVPEAVYDTREELEGEDPAETKLAMDYTTLIPVLVKAIQELEAKVALLEAQLAGS